VVPGVVILTTACVAIGWTPDLVGIGAGLLGFAIVAILGTALALLFSAANVFFRDVSNIVSTLTIFSTFSAPMIYPYSMVEERFGAAADYYLLNPLAESVLLIQRCFWTGTTDDPAATEMVHLPDNLFQLGFAHLAAALLVLALAQVVFSRLEKKFAERL
jgi:ABC-2 type transport system permease protein